MTSVDELLEVLSRSRHERYGENLDMLDHALQTAAVAREAGASNALVVAALVHDVGHLLGDAGQWGLPGHAEVGAAWLSSMFGPEVTEPVRLHVEAKRWLVATDDTYMDQLSLASQKSLVEQGGPLNEQECQEFAGQAGAREAAQLRRWDDGGKDAESARSVPELASYRDLLQSVMLAAQGTGRQAVSAAWARDACRCATCRDPISDQHLVTPDELIGWTVVAGPQPETARPGEAMTVHVRRSDGTEHRCEIPARAPVQRRPVSLWGTGHYPQLLNEADSGPSLQEIAVAVDAFGIALVRDVAPNPGEVLRFAERLGFVRTTNYGRLFDVVSEPDAQNLAYTSLGLPLHTDNPYRDPVPTVQLLHCLKPAREGGASRFSDGFLAADLLRRHHPEDFAVLTSTVCRFRYHGGSTAHGDAVDLVADRPLIEVAPDGAVTAVSLNHRSMEAPDPTEIDVDRFYDAYERFNALVSSEEAVIDHVMAVGDLIVFDNRRVLHARTAFTDDGGRHLQGCYIDMDALRSTAATATPAAATTAAATMTSSATAAARDLVVQARAGSSPVQHRSGEAVDIADRNELGLTDRLVQALLDWAQFFDEVDGDLTDGDVADEFVGQAFKLAHKLRGELKGSTVHLIHPLTGEAIEIIRTTPK